MNRLFKLILLAFILFFSFVGIGSYVVVNFYGDQIKIQILDQLNNNLNTEVNINGPIELSFFSSFPQLAVEINDINITESYPNSEASLLKAKKLYAGTSILSLLDQDWNLNAVIIEEGLFHMKRKEDGTPNYKFTESQKDTSSKSSNFLLNIHKASFKNVQYIYDDEFSDVHLDLSIKEALISGNFSPKDLSIKVDAEIFSKAIKVKSIDYGKEKELQLVGKIKINTDRNSYALDVKELNVANNPFAIKGSFILEEKIPVFDLNFNGKQIEISDLPKILPEKYAEYMGDVQGKGKMELKAKLSGPISKQHDPSFTADIEIKKAALSYRSAALNNFTAQVSYTNGKSRSLKSSLINIKSLKSGAGQEQIELTGTINDFTNVKWAFIGNGYLDFSLLNEVLGNSFIKDLKGSAQLDDFKYDVASNSSNAILRGSVIISELSFKIDTTMVRASGGKATFTKDLATIDGLQLNGQGLEAVINGQAINYNKPDMRLQNASIEGKYIDIKKLLAMVDFMQKAVPTSSDQSKTKSISGDVQLKSHFVQYDKFKAYDASGLVQLYPKQLKVSKVSMNAMDGVMDFSGTATWTQDKVNFTAQLDILDLQISELFYEMNDFGQEQLTSKNLEGIVTAGLKVNGMVKGNKLDYNSLTASTDIKIKDGRLIGYKPLESLSKYVDIDELRDIQFSTLTNNIRISNNQIVIPEMHISSSALNLSFEGKHSFQNVIDYKIGINVMEVLARKIRKRKDHLLYHDASETNFNFTVNMVGPLADPDISVGRQPRRKSIREEKPITENQKTRQTENAWDEDEELEFIEWDEDE